MSNIVSLSGGKDSTAMLHLMLERGESIKAVIWCDMGDWEFPEMAAHIAQVERNTGIAVTRVSPRIPLSRMAFELEYLHEYLKDVWSSVRGYGWPAPMKRWCTAEKRSAIQKVVSRIGGGVQCIGLAADETGRRRLPDKRYPLDEYGYTEADCLAYCRRLGYDWGGLYEIYHRVSCWCCPLQSIRDLRMLRRHRPALWARLLEMDKRNPPHNRGFKDTTVAAFERRFAAEDRQLTIGGYIREART